MKKHLLLIPVFSISFIFSMKETKKFRRKAIQNKVTKYKKTRNLDNLINLEETILDKEKTEGLSCSEECLLCSVLYKEVMTYHQDKQIKPIIEQFESTRSKLLQSAPLTKQPEEKFNKFMVKLAKLRQKQTRSKIQLHEQKKVRNDKTNRELFTLYRSLEKPNQHDKKRITELQQQITQNPTFTEIWPDLYSNKE